MSLSNVMWSVRLGVVVFALWSSVASANGATHQAHQAIFHNEEKARPINVAIIGAGAAGSSSAYHLSRFAQSASLDLKITVFERNAYVGGRSTTVGAFNVTSLPVELGASIFVKVNSILVSAAEEFNLSTTSLLAQADQEIPGPDLGIWDGTRFVLTQNTGGSWWDLAKLLWRYGYAPIGTLNLMKRTVGKFLKMYDEPIFPFDSLTKAAEDVGLLEATAATGQQYMLANGITGAFGQEVVQASTRVNYAQNLAYIHGLEAMVCMATQGAMQIEGGNWKIFEHMLKSSGATIELGTKATSVKSQDNGSLILDFKSQADTASRSFDAVIIAAPHQFADLDLDAAPRRPDEIPYVSLYVTLFTSPHLLSSMFFNLAPGEPVPHTILTTLPEDESPERGSAGVGSPGFFSISLLQSIINPQTKSPEYLYKIFSPAPPNATFLAGLLGVQDLPGNTEDHIREHDVSWIYRKLWHSYPYEFPRVTFDDPRLGNGVWYTGGMDSFISTMETNALMGKNVAKLLVDDLIKKSGAY